MHEKVDLHGYHIHEGWRKFNQHMEQLYYNNIKRATVITGQGRMMQEFPTLADNCRYVKEYKQDLRNKGSWNITFIKKGNI